MAVVPVSRALLLKWTRIFCRATTEVVVVVVEYDWSNEHPRTDWYHSCADVAFAVVERNLRLDHHHCWHN